MKRMKRMKQTRGQTLRSKQAEIEPQIDVRGEKTAKAAAAPHQLSVALKCDAGNRALLAPE